MKDSVERAKAVRLYRDIQTARRMLMTIDVKEKNRDKSTGFKDQFNAFLTTYRGMRKEQRACQQLTKAGHWKNTKQSIESNVEYLCRLLSTKNIRVGGEVKVGEKRGTVSARRIAWTGSVHIEVHVGFMWNKNVWEKIHKENRMTSAGFIVLSATEYRTNVPHIRIYEATAYNHWKRKVVTGWVGQSKLGKQQCAFITGNDRKLAINEAVKLAAQAVDRTIKGENQ